MPGCYVPCKAAAIPFEHAPGDAVRLEVMFSISQDPVPDDALLRTYQGGAHPERWARYGDCFSVSVDRPVLLAEFVAAFYTSAVFRIERLLLRTVATAPCSDAPAMAVANGSATDFAVWRVGERTPNQLLMCDTYERTRSWFGVVPLASGRTLLRFGSALAAAPRGSAGTRPAGGFRLLLSFHLVYSQVLLQAARIRVMNSEWRKDS